MKNLAKFGLKMYFKPQIIALETALIPVVFYRKIRRK